MSPLPATDSPFSPAAFAQGHVPAPDHTRVVAPAFDPAWVVASADRCGVSRATAEAAMAAVRTGRVVGVALSGKLASGKDTVAAAVVERLGLDDVEHCFFARPLKAEMDEVMGVLRTSPSQVEATARVADELAMPADAAATLVEALWEPARADRSMTARSRTPEVRWALQFLGTDVRRAQDPDWWAMRSLADLLTAFAAGRSVYFTDCRFPNEVDVVRRAGCFTVRLDVSAATQAERLWSRDGLAVDPTVAAHRSETALDDYTAFDLRVDNDGPAELAVELVAAHLVAHHRSISAPPAAA